MKKLIFTLLTIGLSFLAVSQEDMPLVWSQDMGIKFVHSGTGLESGGYSYVASAKEMAVFSNEDGSIYWKKSFKDIAPKLKKIDELVPFWESNIIFLFDRKAGKDQIACIDLTDGSLLWTTDKYQKITADMIVYIEEDDGFAISLKKELVYIKAKTGEEVWSTSKFHGVVGKYVYNSSDHSMTMVNFVPSAIIAYFTGMKNQIVRINMQNGDILWENTYVGRADRKVITRDFIYDLEVDGDKVVLRLGGIQVYDYITGANLWSAAFDYTAEGIVKRPRDVSRWGVYGTVADPVVVGDDMYVLDMTDKKHQYVKKYDYHTGKLLWTSKEIKGARAIPGMTVVGDAVALQIGGMVELQYTQTIKTEYYTITYNIVKYKNVKPNGIQAFNTKDGSLKWESEKFRKGITNGITVGDNFIVCSGKALYSINISTGADNYEVPVSKGGVGLAQLILPYGDNIIVVIGEKGLSTFNATDGAFIKKSVYKKSTLSGRIGNIVLMKTDKDDIAAFNLSTMTYTQYNAKKGARTWLEREDAKYVYVYEKKKVTKLLTH
ncbi:MAG: PQQ-binding-like beta-propeller repeat protein [Chlorobi bacterium]|nr:PQQ-binding-like beta-propeller repeat protein [Chlorobiota bacterium]